MTIELHAFAERKDAFFGRREKRILGVAVREHPASDYEAVLAQTIYAFASGLMLQRRTPVDEYRIYFVPLRGLDTFYKFSGG